MPDLPVYLTLTEIIEGQRQLAESLQQLAIAVVALTEATEKKIVELVEENSRLRHGFPIDLPQPDPSSSRSS